MYREIAPGKSKTATAQAIPADIAEVNRASTRLVGTRLGWPKAVPIWHAHAHAFANSPKPDQGGCARCASAERSCTWRCPRRREERTARSPSRASWWAASARTWDPPPRAAHAQEVSVGRNAKRRDGGQTRGKRRIPWCKGSTCVRTDAVPSSPTQGCAHRGSSAFVALLGSRAALTLRGADLNTGLGLGLSSPCSASSVSSCT